MKPDECGYWWEVYLTQEEWARIPISRQMWYNSDPSGRIEERQQVAHEMGLVAQGFVLSVLTPRQRQVVELYCLEGRTQVEIAEHLGISQATVSQHLKGKLRGGRYVGGAFPKIRKAIHKAAKMRGHEESRYAQILDVFDELLDVSITRRRSYELICSLSQNRQNEGKS